MIVCIAEKPSVAGEIARVVGANSRKEGYYEGNGYQVTWTFGHLCELKNPDEYTSDWKRWDLRYLPMVPPRFGIKLKDDAGVKKQFFIIQKLFQAATEIVNCGDAGQEGELIQRWVLQKTGSKAIVKRLWISSLTEESIREGFKQLKPTEAYQKLYEAGLCRAIGDWLLGMNATRLYTLRFGGYKQVLSIGRVQTPTLAIVVKRELEIRNFKPEKYWELATEYRNVLFCGEKGRYSKREEGEEVVEAIAGQPFEVTGVEKKTAKEAPPRLYDLTSLQVDCNKSFGLSAEDTLRLIQSLYEKKLTTYPRVDTTYLSEDMYAKCPGILHSLSHAGYGEWTAPLEGGKLPKSKKVFDNSKVTDHHAIVPTGDTRSPMSEMERKVYDKVAKRFVSVFYPDCEKAVTKVTGKVARKDGKEVVQFKVSGTQIVKPGWRAVYGAEADAQSEEKKDDGEGRLLPDFEKGESGLHTPKLQEKETSAPKPYTEATLLRAMETAGKTVEDPELRDAMKENGIGRPSTRASIIETLLKRRYIQRGGAGRGKKSLMATETGIALIDTIGDERLKSAELTGVWEKKLRDIEKGTFSAREFIDELKTMVNEVVQQGKAMEAKQLPIADNIVTEMKNASQKRKRTHSSKQLRNLATKMEAQAAQKLIGTPCPKCGQGVVIKGHAAYGCSRWKEGCDWRQKF